jgi:CheY-like chemotaxis protein
MGFSVVAAADGREALEIFNNPENTFNLVLLDLIMPVMDGIETYHELRKISPYVPVVICSGYGDDELRDVIERDDRAEFIQKPYKPLSLFETFNRIMG